ncbi:MULTISPECIES: hypothetical protein [unclassified Crossiella]|uniref:hypothetical protein n=1 Tax=unclassified Crossiella TaxID=2620835 RepID=UPI001FFF804F|nr:MULTISPECIES: hypothetical protein [unclassified Crossiella]MCK2240513.1 hypothetical protein [Crossiella sp. S99.2]MCK2253036.1 hypothetical protein [Crossiella sp. S99.1]
MADMTPEEQRQWNEYQSWSTQVQAVKQSQLGLNKAIGEGKLRVTPEAAKAAAAACRKTGVELRAARLGLRFELDQTHLGDCQAGLGLAAQFKNKYEELKARLFDGEQILENMAKAYEAAGRAYQAAEDANRNNLQRKR